VGTTTRDLAGYLATFTRAWPKQEQWAAWGYPPATIASRHGPADVAGWLIADAEFKALKLGNWLGTPDGKLVMAAIEMLAPAPYAQDAELLANAVQLAAKQQQSEARAKIFAVAAIGGAVIALGASGGK
jgi:hypothetical protein